VFHNGLLYARDGLGKQPPGYLFDSRNGKLMTRYPVGPAPAFDGDLGFFVRTDAFVRAFDTRTRQVKWTQDAAGLTTAPLVANGVVYLGSDTGQLYALNETTGAILWQASVPTWPWNAAVLSSGIS
jgi:outer membrane protein assembly factor BamB